MNAAVSGFGNPEMEFVHVEPEHFKAIDMFNTVHQGKGGQEALCFKGTGLEVSAPRGLHCTPYPSVA